MPEVLLKRPLSVRAYDSQYLIAAAEVTSGRELPAVVTRLFGHDDTRFLHVHHAGYGCYHCRIDRA